MSVIIIGGGMAGATLALALSHFSQGRMKIDLVEAELPTSANHSGFDARSIALAQGTCQRLDEIGIWSKLSAGATPITRVQVSDRGHSGFVTIDAKEYAIPALGQTIELHDTGKKLFALLANAAGVTLHCPTKMVGVNRSDEMVEIRLDNGKTLSAQLAVAADGSLSPLGKAVNINWLVEDYHQVAFIANVVMAEAHQGRAFERFTPSGPLALLPMSKGRCSLVWCHDDRQQKNVAAWNDADFTHQLQKAFGWRLGEVKQVGKRYSYPLKLRKAERRFSHRVALIGNAAQTLHPIAGQGFNLGIRDVMSLAEELIHAFTHGKDIGSFVVLDRYNQRRNGDRDLTISLTDGLICLFANDCLPLTFGRNCAMSLMDSLPLVRDGLVRRTLGLVER